MDPTQNVDLHETLRTVSDDANRQRTESRSLVIERFTTLGSVVFGLSFLALQLVKPESVGTIIAAWIFLSTSIISGGLISLGDWWSDHIFSSAAQTSFRDAAGKRSAPISDIKPATVRQIQSMNAIKWGRALLVTTMSVSFSVGVVLMLIFATSNI